MNAILSHFMRNRWKLLLTALAICLFAYIPLVVQSVGNPSLGDWGDYIGGAMAVIVFIWLVAGHLENQGQIAASNRDMEAHLEMTREVVGALATIAVGNKVQAAQVLADSAPNFVLVDSTGQQTGRNSVAAVPTCGYFRFRNDGRIAQLTSVQVSHPEVSCKLVGNDMSSTGGQFKVEISSNKPLRNAWPIDITIFFKTKFGIAGWARIKAKSFDEVMGIKHGTGNSSDESD